MNERDVRRVIHARDRFRRRRPRRKFTTVQVVRDWLAIGAAITFFVVGLIEREIALLALGAGVLGMPGVTQVMWTGRDDEDR